MKKVCLEKIFGCSIPIFLFKLTSKKDFIYARLWNGSLRIMRNRGNNAKASWFHQKMAPGLGENIDKMIEMWNPGTMCQSGDITLRILLINPLGRTAARPNTRSPVAADRANRADLGAFSFLNVESGRRFFYQRRK